MVKTSEQLEADAALDKACLRVIRAYGMLPDEPTIIDYLSAYADLAYGLLNGALEVMRVATEGEPDGEKERPA